VPQVRRRDEAHDEASVAPETAKSRRTDLSGMWDSFVLFVRLLGKLTPLLRKAARVSTSGLI
jgi:hypothetical protein